MTVKASKVLPTKAYPERQQKMCFTVCASLCNIGLRSPKNVSEMFHLKIHLNN